MKKYGRHLFNSGWEFAKLSPGSSREDALAAEWKMVQLPHDWLIWQAGDLYESADAWYRRILRSEEADAPTAILSFDGVYMDCDILLNGAVICSHPYGYTAFQADLNGRMHSGENEIMVHIRHRSPNSRWYSGSGIYRDVHLILLPEAYLVPDSLYTVTEQTGQGWRIQIEAEASGEGEAYARLLDGRGEKAAETTGTAQDGKVSMELFLSGGERWSPSSPALYTLEYGMGCQTERARIGLRTMRFDPDSGFWLNEENIKLKGVCLHHDLGALGSAFHRDAAARQLRIMQEMGVNAVRTSHNPPARQFLDLCDEMGILVIDELLDMWERPKTTYDYARFFPEWESKDVASWIRRDRNHPCVIMWSIGNEIYEMFADERGREITRMLRDQVHEHDPAGHAAVTFGSNYMPWEGAQRCAEEIGIPGYNYAERYYAVHHADHPGWVIYGSETASVLSSRGIYHFPASCTILSDEDLQCSALGNSISSWGAHDLKKMIVEDLNTPFSMGQFVWSGFDYIGEPTPYHTRSCYFGQVDTAGFPKDSFYLFRSLWTDGPMIHLGVYWDWNEGQMIDVPVMSSCARVELELNGRSLGIREINRRDSGKCMAMWRVPFEKGILRAIGTDEEGNVLCEDRQVSFGDTRELRITYDDHSAGKGEKKIAFLKVEAFDENGNQVANARDRLYVDVCGGGTLLGLDNGDATDPDEYKGTTKRLFGGKMLIMVGGNGRKETTRVLVRSTEGIRTEFVLEKGYFKENSENAFFQMVPASPETEEIPVRRVEIIPLEGRELTPEKKEAAFAWKVYPAGASDFSIRWQITTEAGIETPCAEVREENGIIRVTAKGDGEVMLRALYGNAADHPEQISQTELRLSGFGSVKMDPYEFISAGLYDLKDGDIGAGNDHGITFARDSGESMVGFSGLDFGTAGSDRIMLSIFALNDEVYRIRVYDGNPLEGGRLIDALRYQKPSIWNVYQEESWQLPERLTGFHTICFVGDRKFHLKGFRFEKQSRAFIPQRAIQADAIYGDSFRKEGTSVLGIGNNVTLTWENMDFGDLRTAELFLEGRTPLETNAITLKMENENGETVNEVIRFHGTAQGIQRFRIAVPGGSTVIHFVFLPGSQFDFDGFRFEP